MTLKLDGLSPKELASLIAAAQSKMEAARVEQIRTVRAKIDALLKSAGLQLNDVYAGSGSAGKKRAKRAGAGVPKYRNPADPAQTWTGFGKKPAWFVKALKSPGVTAESLLIQRAPAAVKTAARTAKRATRKRATKKVSKSK